MKNLIKITCIFLSIFICIFTQAQVKRYTTANAHSHNDYLNDMPFYRAFKNGFGSIEADIFPVKGILNVAHRKSEIQPGRTLKSLYLNPLLNELASDSSRRLKLLVDIKEDYKIALQLLIQELQPLKQYLSSPQVPNRLTILISGQRPPPAEYKNYPDYILFDDDLKLYHTPEEWNRVGLVSLPFVKLSSWKGEGSIRNKDKSSLRHTIDSVHAAGKQIRFWASPDTKTSWMQQMKMRVDLIGTDKIDELANFLRSRSVVF